MSFPPNLGITSSFIIGCSSSSSVFQDLYCLLQPLDQICSPFSRSKMNGYSRITKDAATRSKSVDFADLPVSPNFSKFKSQETKPSISDAGNISTIQSSIPEDGSEKRNGKVFGIVLSKEYLTHSGPSDEKLMAEEQRAMPKFQTVVKKTASIKRSFSVSEGYSRIHHQSGLAAGDVDQNRTEFTPKHRYKKGKFLGACRRLFGL